MEFSPLPVHPGVVLLPKDPRRYVTDAGVDTLADLLSNLGHHCRGRCPTETVSLDGLVGVIPRRGLPASVALVLFDLTERPEPLVEIFRVLRTVNNCTRLDRIRVLPADGARHSEPHAPRDHANGAADDPTITNAAPAAR